MVAHAKEQAGILPVHFEENFGRLFSNLFVDADMVFGILGEMIAALTDICPKN